MGLSRGSGAQNRLGVEVFGRLTDQTDHADNMVWR